MTDGNGGTTTWHYDGYQRDRGFTDQAGTTRTHWLDAAGNIVRAAVAGPAAAAPKRTRSAARRAAVPLLEATYEYDEWNRVVRIDEAWRDAGGKPLGASGWDDREGVVSTVMEYGAHGRVARAWREGGNVVSVLS